MTRRRQTRTRLAFAGLAAFGILSMSAAASAQEGAKERSRGGTAVDAATSPLNDLNIMSRDIPPVLLQAQADPYSLIGMTKCSALEAEIAVYDDVLGPDANVQDDGRDLVKSGLRAGGKIASGFIPFRGVVREISGANSKQREREAAIYAGVARRSFLKGYARGRECAFVNDAIAVTSEPKGSFSAEELERIRAAREEDND